MSPRAWSSVLFVVAIEAALAVAWFYRSLLFVGAA